MTHSRVPVPVITFEGMDGDYDAELFTEMVTDISLYAARRHAIARQRAARQEQPHCEVCGAELHQEGTCDHCDNEEVNG